MRTLIFKGQIRSGVGRHVELGIPGRDALINAPLEWPEKLQPGSLNIGVHSDGYPEELIEYRDFEGVITLDRKLIPPAFLIPREYMKNNKLRSDPDMPDRGVAQVWRATLIVESAFESYPVWVLRRLGSRVGEQLELVSEVHLRDTLSLQDGMSVTVALQYEKEWSNKTNPDYPVNHTDDWRK